MFYFSQQYNLHKSSQRITEKKIQDQAIRSLVASLILGYTLEDEFRFQSELRKNSSSEFFETVGVDFGFHLCLEQCTCSLIS